MRRTCRLIGLPVIGGSHRATQMRRVSSRTPTGFRTPWWSPTGATRERERETRWGAALSGATDYIYTHFPSKTRQKYELFCISWWRLINVVPLQCKNWGGGGVCVCVTFLTLMPFSDRQKKDGWLKRRVANIHGCLRDIYITVTNTKRLCRRVRGDQVIKTLKQMCPCVRPSVRAGAFKQLSAEELA